MIKLGKRTQCGALLAVAALGISSNALAQTPPAPPPDPAAPNAPPAAAPVPADPGAPATTSTPPPLPAVPPPEPAPPPPAVLADPPKTTFPAMGGPFLRLNELFSFRPGLLLQFWAQAAQDPIKQANGDDGNFSKNMYLRRARFYLAGTLTPRITWTLLVESSNLGLAANNATTMGVEKSYTTPSVGAPVSFGFNDAYLDLKINQNVSVQAGVMLIPFTRNILQSTATYWAIDIGAVSATYIAATQTNTLRDAGVQVKINGAGNHFEARAMVSQGVKLPDSSGGGRSPGKNDPRFTGFLQYNFLDPDTGYVFNGQYFGKKRIAGVAVGADYQKLGEENAYFATSATAFAAIPVGKVDLKNGGDEIGGQVEFLHFHPGRFPAPVTTFAKQNDLLVELGYYNKNAKLSVFGKFEGRFFDDDRILIPPDNKIDINDSRLYGGGLKYFLAEQLANLTLQYSYTQLPNKVAALPRNNTSLIQLQLQLAY